jgi:hypothetical protein
MGDKNIRMRGNLGAILVIFSESGDDLGTLPLVGTENRDILHEAV